jgi:hypothetical protein
MVRICSMRIAYTGNKQQLWWSKLHKQQQRPYPKIWVSFCNWLGVKDIDPTLAPPWRILNKARVFFRVRERCGIVHHQGEIGRRDRFATYKQRSASIKQSQTQLIR